MCTIWALLLLLQGVDPELPRYRPEEPVLGSLNSVGSDTLNNLITLWAEEFQRRHPGARVEVEGRG